MIYKNQQKGIYAVEFSIVAAVFFVIFFAVFEGARLMYTWNVLTEVTRRGARLASVCQVDGTFNPKSDVVKSAATFSDLNLIPNLSSANLNISYLSSTGAVAMTFTDINFVRAEVVDYKHQLLIPFVSITLNSPSFSTTLPAESLGVTRFGYTNCS